MFAVVQRFAPHALQATCLQEAYASIVQPIVTYVLGQVPVQHALLVIISILGSVIILVLQRQLFLDRFALTAQETAIPVPMQIPAQLVAQAIKYTTISAITLALPQLILLESLVKVFLCKRIHLNLLT